MKSFKIFIKESKEKHVVFAFGRMNPPTTGHQHLVNKVKSLASDHGADHLIVLSRSHDPKKNPLHPDEKLKHANHFFPNTNIKVAEKDHPTFIHQLHKLHKAGYQHVTMVAGSDRIKEYQGLIDKYNGKPNRDGVVPFHFKSASVKSSGERDPDSEGVSGMSASKMRKHAAEGNFNEFKKGIPSHVTDSYAKGIFNSLRKSK